MKRYICATSNKKPSLQKAAEVLRTEIYYNRNLYQVVPNYEENRIDVKNAAGDVMTEYTLQSVKEAIQRRKFREATPEESANGAKLYVAEYYDTVTDKQIPKIAKYNHISQTVVNEE